MEGEDGDVEEPKKKKKKAYAAPGAAKFFPTELILMCMFVFMFIMIENDKNLG